MGKEACVTYWTILPAETEEGDFIDRTEYRDASGLLDLLGWDDAPGPGEHAMTTITTADRGTFKVLIWTEQA